MVRQVVAVALFLSVLMFMAGYFMASAIEENKIYEIKAGMKDIEELYTTTDLLLLLFPEKCPEKPQEVLFPIYARLEELRRSFEVLEESRLLVDKKKYLSVAEDYALLNLRAWALSEKMRKTCHNFYTALFIFQPESPESIAARMTLESTKRRLKDRFLLFHLDITVDNPAVAAFRNLWNITEAPCIILDSKKICGFEKIKEAVEALK